MAQQMQTSGAELAMIQDGIRNLSVGQETLTRRADEQEAALQQMRREFQTLEKELNEFKECSGFQERQPGADTQIWLWTVGQPSLRRTARH